MDTWRFPTIWYPWLAFLQPFLQNAPELRPVAAPIKGFHRVYLYSSVMKLITQVSNTKSYT